MLRVALRVIAYVLAIILVLIGAYVGEHNHEIYMRLPFAVMVVLLLAFAWLDPRKKAR